jgi:hypothetical protein
MKYIDNTPEDIKKAVIEMLDNITKNTFVLSQIQKDFKDLIYKNTYEYKILKRDYQGMLEAREAKGRDEYIPNFQMGEGGICHFFAEQYLDSTQR